jgi:hypothetical protein
VAAATEVAGGEAFQSQPLPDLREDIPAICGWHEAWSVIAQSTWESNGQHARVLRARNRRHVVSVDRAGAGGIRRSLMAAVVELRGRPPPPVDPTPSRPAAARCRVMVSIWNKSQARILCAWARRNSVQEGPARRGAGSIPALCRIFQIVEAPI